MPRARSLNVPKGPKPPTTLERGFMTVWRGVARGALEPKREFRFHSLRQWKFDFAWPECRVAVEVEGGIFIRGGHNRGMIYTQNCEKYNAATILGWAVLRYTTKDLESRPVQCCREVLEFLKTRQGMGPAREDAKRLF
jgi:very-short-patch-repair endonuclease